MILLAQADIGSLKADFIKSMVILCVVLVVVASVAMGALVAWLQYRHDRQCAEDEARRDREAKPREILPQPLPVEKVSRRYNHDATEQRFKTVEAKIGEHDEEISELRQRFTDDLPAMERRLNEASESRAGATHERVNEILEAVGELRGAMNAKK